MSEPQVPTPEAPTPDPERRRALDDRYGRSRQRGVDRRVGWIAGGAAVVVGAAVIAFGGWQSASTVEYQDIGRTIVDEHRVDVRFEVTAPAHAPVACAIEAQNQTKAVVGWKILELPVSEQRTHAVSTSVVTTNRASTGSVRSCWVLETDD